MEILYLFRTAPACWCLLKTFTCSNCSRAPNSFFNLWKTSLKRWNLLEFRKLLVFPSCTWGEPGSISAALPWHPRRSHKCPESLCCSNLPQPLNHSWYSSCYGYHWNSDCSCGTPLPGRRVFVLSPHHTFHRNFLCSEMWQCCWKSQTFVFCLLLAISEVLVPGKAVPLHHQALCEVRQDSLKTPWREKKLSSYPNSQDF